MKENTELVGNWCGADNTSRCTACGKADQGNNVVGTPLTLITINVLSRTDPYIPIAKAVICRKCDKVYHINLLPMATKLNITLASIESCMRQTKNADAFKINELHAGRMDKVAFSPALRAIFHKQAESRATGNLEPLNYNPDRFVEQDVPL